MITWRRYGFLVGVLFTVFRSSCSVKVSEVTCTSGGSECPAHSTCDTTASILKCTCDNGYGEDLTDGSTCVKIKVSEVTCTNGGSECPAHSTCDTTASILKCKCDTGYGEDLTDGSTCVMTVSETSCTANGNECDGITHAVCDITAGKCKCSSGYTMDVNTCAADNAGVSARMAFGTLALPAFITVLHIFPKLL